MLAGSASKKRAFAHFRQSGSQGREILPYELSTQSGPVDCLRTQWSGILAARSVAGAVRSFSCNPLLHLQSRSAQCPELRVRANAICGEDFVASDPALRSLFW